MSIISSLYHTHKREIPKNGWFHTEKEIIDLSNQRLLLNVDRDIKKIASWKDVPEIYYILSDLFGSIGELSNFIGTELYLNEYILTTLYEFVRNKITRSIDEDITVYTYWNIKKALLLASKQMIQNDRAIFYILHI